MFVFQYYLENTNNTLRSFETFLLTVLYRPTENKCINSSIRFSNTVPTSCYGYCIVL